MTTSTTDTGKRLSDVELAEVRGRASKFAEWCKENEPRFHRHEYQGQLDRSALLAHIAAISAPPSQGKVERARAAASTFYEHIKHGDEKHRAWLKEECDGKLSELISQALTEPAQGTSVEGAETMAKKLFDMFAPLRSGPWEDMGESTKQYWRDRIADLYGPLPLPVSEDGSAKRDAALKEIAAAFETRTIKDGVHWSDHALDNLEGVIIDIERLNKADPVSMRTLKRVSEQLARIERALKSTMHEGEGE